jgi:hypothetical protein
LQRSIFLDGHLGVVALVDTLLVIEVVAVLALGIEMDAAHKLAVQVVFAYVAVVGFVAGGDEHFVAHDELAEVLALFVLQQDAVVVKLVLRYNALVRNTCHGPVGWLNLG